jgi:hypothetical protein
MEPVTIVCEQEANCSERLHAVSAVIGVVAKPLSVIQAAAKLANTEADDAISRNALALGAALSVRGRAAATADVDCQLQTSVSGRWKKLLPSAASKPITFARSLAGWLMRIPSSLRPAMVLSVVAMAAAVSGRQLRFRR